MVAGREFTEGHDPLCKTALYIVVWVRLLYVSDVVVLAIGLHVTPLLIEDSHLIIFPIWPLRVSVPVLLPEHTIASDATEPPTEAGSTVTVAEPVCVARHAVELPSCTLT